jgi:hypothetical protein
LANTRIDLQLIIVSGDRTIGASPEDIDLLLRSPIFRPVKAKTIRGKKNRVVQLLDETELDTNRQKRVKVKAKSELVSDLAGKMLEVVKKRCNSIVMTVDPLKDEDL